MRALSLYCFATVFAVIVLVSHGVSDDQDTSPNSLEFSTAGVEVARPDDGIGDLRRQYLDAAKQRASLMDERALRQAIDAGGKMVAELRAQQAFNQAEQQLQQITREYPDTRAGRRAQKLLHALQGVDDDHFDQTFPVDRRPDFPETRNGNRSIGIDDGGVQDPQAADRF